MWIIARIPLFLQPRKGNKAAEVRFAQRSFSEGAVAQSVEQRTENPCVGGSIPPHTTNRIKQLQ